MNKATFQIFYLNDENKRVSCKRKLPVFRSVATQRSYVEIALLSKGVGVSRLIEFRLA